MTEVKPQMIDLVGHFSRELRIEAKNLKDMPFKYRTEKMARLVAAQTSILLSTQLGNIGVSEELSSLLFKACMECGNRFDETKPDFNFSKAKNATGEIATPYIKQALNVCGNDTDFKELVDKVDPIDIVKQLAAELGIRVKPDLKVDDIKPALRKVVSEGDFFKGEIEELRDTGNNLTTKEVEALHIAETFTATEYVNNQLPVAIHDGNDERLNRLQFNPYPKVKELKFKEIIKDGFSELEALYGVAFEVWKDIKMLKDVNVTPENS